MGSTVLSRGIETIRRDELTPVYNVVLLDDDDHTYDYVIEMLQALFVFSQEHAYRHAVEVDTHGRTILLTCALPEAEFDRDQIHTLGPDRLMPPSQVSMSALKHPARLRSEYALR